MSNDFDDKHFNPGVQAEPLKGFEELADILDPATGRLYGKFGAVGMTIEDAKRAAALWWDEKGRKMMPDAQKGDDYLNSFGMKSGILLGRAWDDLNLGEKIQIVKHWHAEIGVFQYGLTINERDLPAFVRSFNLAQIFGGMK